MSVKVTYVWNKSVGTCDLVSGETTVVDAASKTFNITNPSEEKAEQLRITAIEVVYKAVNP